MNGSRGRRAKAVIGVVAIAVAGTAWAGCGSDDVDEAADDIQQEAEQAGEDIQQEAEQAGQDIQDEAQEAGEDIQDQAQELEDEVSGDDSTTTTEGSAGGY